uniref:DEAD/DEAH box helicase n=1 Tax=Flavobacterium sp. TaxID=239 RepID=UPI00404B0D1E
MQLKKINPALQQALVDNKLLTANVLQEETFSTIKSGVDVVIQSEAKSGKSTLLALSVIQRLKKPFEESPRALVMVTDKAKTLEMKELFDQLSVYNELRIYAVHEKTDLDNDKNQISMGIDVLIGTPERLNLLFSGAGYNVNKLDMIVFDDMDLLLRNRFEAMILRLSDSILRGQRVAFCSELTEKVEILAPRIMKDPVIFES